MDKELVILHGKIASPPLSQPARRETGYLLRRLQQGFLLSMPHSRPMSTIGANCHELRVQDVDKTWRLVYFCDEDSVVIMAVFNKTTNQTPQNVIETCKQRLAKYLRDCEEN